MKMIYPLCLVSIFFLCFFISYYKAFFFTKRPHSSPFYYGVMGSLASMGGALICFLLDLFFHFPKRDLGMTLSAVLEGILSWDFITDKFQAQYWVEKCIRVFLRGAAFVAIAITIAIVTILLFETFRFFKFISFTEFFLNTQWHPETSYENSSQAQNYGHYGILPLLTGTLLITAIALIIAVPLGLFIAIYLREYARPPYRNIVKPLIEILAGIPTIVYGFFALVGVIPLLQALGKKSGFEISSQSALGVGMVMGLMIIPYISSLSEEALNAIPQVMRDNSLALGATPSETIKKVIIPAAMPSLITAVLLSLSRAIGETMLVVMAAGLTPNFTLNPLESVTTVTVQMVSLLTGDQEFNSPKTLSAFALGITLFSLTFIFNVISLKIIKSYRRRYET